jgi:predicted transglutaminase-like cysteine proteinase
VRSTLKEMSKLVRTYKTHATVRECAQQLTRHLRSYDRMGEITSIAAFCRDDIRYVNDVDDVETIQAPDYTLNVGSGDCDDKSILCNALLASIGYQTLFFAVGLNGQMYEHVMGGVRLGTRTIPIETIVPLGSMGPGSGQVGWMHPEANPIWPWNI